MSTEPLSLRAYARHRGVSLRAVQKAITSGRIAKRDDGLVDPETADLNWSRNTGPRPQSTNTPVKTEIQSKAEDRSTGANPVGRANEPARLETGLEYSKARAIRESYLARLTKIDFEERSGQLVSRDEVQVAAFNKFRQFRDRILNIPDRIAAEAAAESDPIRVHELMTIEIRRALVEFSDADS